jgi:hypothetical protein
LSLEREKPPLAIKRSQLESIDRRLFVDLLDDGWDPGYILKVEPDDIPSFTKAREKVDVILGPDFRVKKFYVVFLSKGPNDPNKRIVAMDEFGDWVRYLWISLLRRQVREGTQEVKVECYNTLEKLECDEGWRSTVDRFTQDLLSKRRF